MGELTFAGPSGIVVLSVYAVVMLVIGYFAGKGQPGVQKTTRSYYLAGGGLGFVSLFFTLYATQYSGNSIVGYAPEAYRSGFVWWQSVGFMIAVIATYLVFAPRLYVVAKRHGFVTPTDWIRHRFRSSAVSILVIALMLWGLANYLLEQLVAMGQGIAGLTGETVPYQIGVVAFVLVMLVYSWSGGMRAVAFTDVMQGIALLIGVGVLLVGVMHLVDYDLGGLTQYLRETEPEKVGVPAGEASANWLSMILLVGFGASVYPHAIQRVYAARSERTLKRSLGVMAWMPLVTTGVVFLVGIAGLKLYPGLSDGASERLVGMLANDVAGINLFFYALMILLFGGVVAAIVSTADSALLAFSSVISKDLYGRYINREAPEHRQVLVGKVVGVVATFALLLLAWNPPTTLYNIFVLKFELLVQIAPAFILGLYWQRLRSGPVFWGMLVGALVAGGWTVFDLDPLYGVPGGLIGLGVNLVVAVAGSLLTPSTGDAGGESTPEPFRPAAPTAEVGETT